MGLSGLPAPEDVFLCWLVAQPDGCDLLDRAEAEIARLGPLRDHARIRDLMHLFEALVLELRTGPARPSTSVSHSRESCAH